LTLVAHTLLLEVISIFHICMYCGGIVVCVERRMIENNVIELWLLVFEYESCDNDCYEYLVYKVSLELLPLALVCYMPCRYVALRAVCVVCPVGMWLYGRCVLFALRVCGFTGGLI
jgi:hypothetical protein